jgi:hypothetical protein
MADNDKITVTFKVDPKSWSKMEELKDLLGTPDVATALYSAALTLERLYDYQNSGYRFAYFDQQGNPHRFDLPKSKAAVE